MSPRCVSALRGQVVESGLDLTLGPRASVLVNRLRIERRIGVVGFWGWLCLQFGPSQGWVLHDWLGHHRRLLLLELHRRVVRGSSCAEHDYLGTSLPST